MLRLYEIIAAVAAICLLLSFLGLGYYSSPPPNYPNEQQSSAEQKKTEDGQEASKSVTGFWRWLFKDSISVFTLWLALATVGLGIIAAFQIGYLGRAENIATQSAKAAKESADVARDTLVALNRPWISADISIASDLTYDDKGDARVVIKFVLKNVGKSPAANVRVDAEIVPIFGDSRPFQKAISERNKIGSGDLGDLGITLFPDETQIQTINLPISRASIDAYLKKTAADYGQEAAKKMGLTYLPTLVGCVDYKFTFAKGHHQTGFILDLRKRDLVNPNNALHFDITEGTIPASRLWLIQGFVGVPPD